MEAFLELFFRDDEWRRTLVSLVVGAILGGATSMLVQSQSNRAAKRRQVRAEQALLAGDLLALVRQRRPLGYQLGKYVVRGQEHYDFQVPFTDLNHRLAMWSSRPDRFAETLQAAAAVLQHFRERSDPTGKADISSVFQSRVATNRYEKIAEPIDGALQSALEAALVRFPLHGDKVFQSEVETATQKALSDFGEAVSDWDFYQERIRPAKA